MQRLEFHWKIIKSAKSEDNLIWIFDSYNFLCSSSSFLSAVTSSFLVSSFSFTVLHNEAAFTAQTRSFFLSANRVCLETSSRSDLMQLSMPEIFCFTFWISSSLAFRLRIRSDSAASFLFFRGRPCTFGGKDCSSFSFQAKLENRKHCCLNIVECHHKHCTVRLSISPSCCGESPLCWLRNPFLWNFAYALAYMQP